ncbi:CD209 antigen-like protein D isoform X5 [Ascaphus truei]|uniref:CD209 antigen-like protein D isoform X5 n=1 Tax=Ascaphus truei TaxID=8439 RepID=UPI003F595B63
MAGNEYQDLQMQECHIYSVLGATSLERSSCESNFLKGLSRHPLPLTHPSMAKASLLQELLSSNCKMNDIMNWTSSKAHCEKKGSSLVVINNKDEQDFLANTVKSTHWLGLSRTIAGYWIWQDTSHLNNNNAYWNFGQPDKNGKENCVSMVSDPKGWNDDSCSKLFRGICEKDIWIRVPLNYLCDKNVYPVI